MISIQHTVKEAAEQLLTQAHLEPEDILVIGCSTSEVIGASIGTAGSLEVAEALFNGLSEAAAAYQVHLAFQCCEHLNRALVMEKSAAKLHRGRVVSVVPHAHAGGSLATCAYRRFEHPVMVERIEAQAGMDIGNTLIGMHLQPVAVPFRSSITAIGQAPLVMATTRPPLIGGERAQYQE